MQSPRSLPLLVCPMRIIPASSASSARIGAWSPVRTASVTRCNNWLRRMPPRWVSAGGKSPSTLERICAKYAAQVDRLAALCATLHPDPAAALSLFVEAVRARDAAFEARDVCRADYARVAARDGQIRLAVDPDGLSYVLQWVKFRDQDLPGVRWIKLFAAASLSPIWAYVLEHVTGIDGPGSAGWVRGDDLLPRWQSLIEGLPERADAGVWPVLPPVPGSLQA